jgi:hypothetical protein
MKPIETEFKGCLFRSRLEARWAVFFDAIGMEWEYEKEGFEKRLSEDETVRYLPDFYLPNSETWVEVKASESELAKEGDRLGKILDWGSPIPGITDSRCDDKTTNGLLLLYGIPYVSWGIVLHPIITHHKGLNIKHCFFDGPHPRIVSQEQRAVFKLFSDIEDEQYIDGWGYTEDGWRIKQYIMETKRANPEVVKAYQKARGSRFEYGAQHG